MNVNVRLFAVARQLAGAEQIEVALPAEATVADLRVALAAAVPEMAPLVSQMMFAVDAEYVDESARIPPQAEIACIPPVSGG